MLIRRFANNALRNGRLLPAFSVELRSPLTINAFAAVQRTFSNFRSLQPRSRHTSARARQAVKAITQNIAELEDTDDDGSRKKRRVAFVVGYCGAGFSGSQVNDGVETIEGTLEKALYSLGFIHERNFGDTKKIGWNRSSRTDKGVHSMCTLMSMKLLIDRPTEIALSSTDLYGQALANQINEKLPEHVRIFAVMRVANSCDVRYETTAREYEYLLPMDIFTELANEQTDREKHEADVLQRINAALQQYEGNYSYHNFTSKSRVAKSLSFARRGATEKPQETGQRPQRDRDDNSSADELTAEAEAALHGLEMQKIQSNTRAVLQLADNASSRAEAIEKIRQFYRSQHEKSLNSHKHDSRFLRTMYTAKCESVIEVDGHRFAKVRILGSSFLIWQVRKMMGAVIGTVLGHLPSDFISLALHTPMELHVPTAPAETLVLYRALIQNDAVPLPIDTPLIREKQQQILNNVLYKHMAHEALLTPKTVNKLVNEQPVVMSYRNIFEQFMDDCWPQNKTDSDNKKLSLSDIATINAEVVRELQPKWKALQDQLKHRESNSRFVFTLPHHMPFHLVREYAIPPASKRMNCILLALEHLAIDTRELPIPSTVEHVMDEIRMRGVDTLVGIGESLHQANTKRRHTIHMEHLNASRN